MNRRLIIDALGWGVVLWLIGYVLGFVLFFVFPPALLGWVIMPIGVLISLWVLIKKIKGKSLRYFLTLAATWTLIAVTFDYLFLVKLLKPADGYYKLDVYLYYFLTFLLPLAVGWSKRGLQTSKSPVSSSI